MAPKDLQQTWHRMISRRFESRVRVRTWAGVGLASVGCLASGRILAQPASSPGPILEGVELPASASSKDPHTLELQDRRGEVLLRLETGVTTPVDPPRNVKAKERLQTSPEGYALILGGRQAAVLGQTTTVEVTRRAEWPGLMIRSGEVYLKSLGAPTSEGLWVQWKDGPFLQLTGTEFHVRFDPLTDLPEVHVLEGRLAQPAPPEFKVHVVNGETLEPFKDVIQWVLYYPPVLDLEELMRQTSWTPDTAPELRDSLTHYRSGDLPRAIEAYPSERMPAAEGERLYRAALLLAAGRLSEAEPLLQSVAAPAAPGSPSPFDRFATALRRTARAVKFQTAPDSVRPILASEWLAESYYQQSLSSRRSVTPSAWESEFYGSNVAPLEKARRAAAEAIRVAPEFGFGHERLAELHFSFGETDRARKAIETALSLTPTNAPALALRGFLRGAQNLITDGLADFERALAIDSKLGTAWLGQGLLYFRKGDPEKGLQSLQLAVLHEPQRAVFRSYLAKGYYEAASFTTHPWQSAKHLVASSASRRALAQRGDEELELARRLDPHDPTPDLYGALIRQDQNRLNESIEQLSQSVAKNDHRALYRSAFLLDQDQAVRSANLAAVYQEAGLGDVAVREAAKGVSYDYANYSSHLFLANGYDALRDPTQFNLRYETAWYNELLLANLLAPVGAGQLSQSVSAQEYSRLFDYDRFRLISATQVRSDGIVRERASQTGTLGSTAYAVDVDYRHHNGVRPNNALDNLETVTTVKHALTPQDTLLLQVSTQEYESGDNFQYYDPEAPGVVRPNFSYTESNTPIVMGGWHHEWSPGMHTLLLAGRISTEQRFEDSRREVIRGFHLPGPSPDSVIFETTKEADPLHYANSAEIYSGELAQIADWEWILLATGIRYQQGSWIAQDEFGGSFPSFHAMTGDFDRIAGYGYVTLHPLQNLSITGGLADDRETYPTNYRHPPLRAGQANRSDLGPKASAVWSVNSQWTLRGIYSRSLGGVSLEDNYRLEPTQLAGFPQTFRSLLPESIVGSTQGARNEVFGLALDCRIGDRTFANLSLEELGAAVRQSTGFFEYLNPTPESQPGFLRESLNYRERSCGVSFAQLIGSGWSVGISYRWTRSSLDSSYRDYPTSVLQMAEPNLDASLHLALAFVQLQTSCGLYAQAGGRWLEQTISGTGDRRSGGPVFQADIILGYRFPRRRAEVQLGLLNLTGEDYRLLPLTPYQEMPRSTLAEGRFLFRF